MSSISQIYFHILNNERRRVKMLPAWRRFWHWKKSKSTMFMEALARMSDLDIAKITEDALGYRLPQFNQHSEGLDTCFSPNQSQDYKTVNPKTISSKSNGTEQQGRRFEGKKFELEKAVVDCNGSEVVMEMSSLSPSSPDVSAANADALHHSQIASKIEFVARRLSVFSSPKNNASVLKHPSSQEHVADGTELCEVIISGGNSDDAAGVGRMQSQQQKSIAHGGPAVQRDAAADGGGHAPPAVTSSRAAVVRTKTLAALALNPRGKGSINSFLAAVRKPIETRDNEAFEKEHSPNISGLALPTSSKPGLGPSSHIAAPQRQVHSAAAQMLIPLPPPRSRSHSCNTATATIDPPASTFVVPPPPPRSRSGSRARVSAGAAGPQAQDDATSPHEPTQVRSAPIAVPVADVAAFQPPDTAKRQPHAAAHTSGGSARAGPPSKNAGSKQAKKSSTDLLQERLQAEYEESMRRMQNEGTSFAEC
jgi:hypothetical protein